MSIEIVPQEEGQTNAAEGDQVQLGPKSFLPFFLIGTVILTGIVFSVLYAEDIITSIIGKERIEAVKEAKRRKKKGLDTIPQTIPVPPADQRLTVLNGLELWLRADAIDGARNGQPVAVWPDASGTERHAIQERKKWQAKWIANGINGKPVLRFDGNETFYPIGNFTDKPGKSTVVTVWAKPKDGGNAFQRLYSSGSEGIDYQSNGVYLVPKTKDNGVGASPPQVHMKRPRKNKDLNNFFIGRLNQNADPPQFFFGDLAEILVYTRRVSDEERDAIRLYLTDKYNLN